jgi:HAD superfamily hydrolase (TIGR01549 family)
MTSVWTFDARDWDGVKLVVFDVDGTLYDQRAMRAHVARDMLLHAIWHRDLCVPLIVWHYRRMRERFGEEEIDEFEPKLLAKVVEYTGYSEARIRAVVAEWLEVRPHAYLMRCRYAGVDALFAGLKCHGKIVGILSDYPATTKLAAMGLVADITCSASDDDVSILKPHPRGLQRLMQRAGVSPAETLLIGDRVERDGLAAERSNVRCLIRSKRAHSGWKTFASFTDPLFASMISK